MPREGCRGPLVLVMPTIGTHGERAVVRQLAAYVAGSVGQGVPFVVLAVEFTRRGMPNAWLAAVAAARIVPYLVCSPVSGVLAGRCRPGRVISVSAAVRAALTVVMLSSLQVLPPWAAVALVALIGVAGTPSYPALMAGLAATVTGTQRQPWGRRVVLLESVAFSAGPAVGGALIVVNGSGRVALVVAITLFAVASVIATGTVAAVGRPQRVAGDHLPLPLRSLSDPIIRSSVVALVVVNVLGGAAMALLPAMARQLRNDSDGLLGWLAASQGIGAVVVVAAASMVAAALRAHARCGGMLVAGGSLLGLSATGHPVLAIAACAVFGGAVVLVEAIGSGELLQHLPASAVGATFGLLDSLLVAAMVAGGVAGPLLASVTGTRWSLALLAIAATVLTSPSIMTSRVGLPGRSSTDLSRRILEGAAR